MSRKGPGPTEKLWPLTRRLGQSGPVEGDLSDTRRWGLGEVTRKSSKYMTESATVQRPTWPDRG